MGTLRLSKGHLLFVQRHGSPEETNKWSNIAYARSLRVGDRVLGLWIDGSVAECEVLGITEAQMCGRRVVFLYLT